MEISCELGVWTEGGVRNTPIGKISWNGSKGKVYTAFVHGKIIAMVRKTPDTNKWAVSIPGFIWDVSGEKGSTVQFYLGIKHSPVKGYSNPREAIKDVEIIYQALVDARK